VGVDPKVARGACGAALVVSLLSGLVGCAPRQAAGGARGLFVTTSLPLASYVQAGSREGPKSGATFFFPQLDIYDLSGNLIYSSHESLESARMLNTLPGGIQGLPPKPDAPRLAEVVERVPGFREKKEQILGRPRVSVISVFLENCEACSLQENALDDARGRLLDHDINLLVIRLSRR